MRIRNKWLLIPPAAALLLFLGPLRLDGPTAGSPAASPAADQAPANSSASSPTLPRTPDLWQVGSTLIGVILLGAAGLFLVGRARQGGKTTGERVFTLRQTMRLGPKQQVWALEFDERLLLLGEHDGKLAVLAEGQLPERTRDEVLVSQRAQAELDLDQGAVPKDLVIPRPDPAPARRPSASPSAPRERAPAAPTLGDFRSLLQKAGRP